MSSREIRLAMGEVDIEGVAELRARFAASFRRLRGEISQRSLARQHGLSQRVISAAESGDHNMTITTLARLASCVEGHVPEMLAGPQDDQPTGRTPVSGAG
jgi:DNA-binding XRE family transcriptional regulator